MTAATLASGIRMNSQTGKCVFTLPCVAFLEGIWYTVWYESGKEANRQMKKQFLEIGKIVSTHGIKGEVRVQAWCDSSEFLTEFDTLYFDKGRTAVEVEEARVHKNVVVMKLAGVNDMNAAQALRNKILYMNRDDVELEEGSYFIQDLLGLQVIDADQPDKVYGKLVDVTETGANDVYHIKEESGSVVLIPAIADVVKETNVEEGFMAITPLKGLFDEAEEVR